MNYTITFSPSIDYIIENKNNKFNNNSLTRVENYYLVPGGKGINASYMMNQIGVKNIALTYAYGKTKDLFVNLLKEYNVKSYKIIPCNCNSDIRINVKYFDKLNHFEINGPSWKLSNNDLDNLKKQLKKLNEKDIVFIMGKCDETILNDLIKFIKSKNANFVIDIDSKDLLSIIKLNPLVIKPNADELSSILKKRFKTNKEIIQAMRELKNSGVREIIVSLGSKGSLILDENDEVYEISFSPLKEVKSTVGCGDTLLSTYVGYKYGHKYSTDESIKKATALSMSTASNWFLGDANDLDKYLKQVKINKK